MTESDVNAHAFYRRFTEQLTEIDELANVILKGHLVVERDLDDVIGTLFPHPEYVIDRLSFDRKIHVLMAATRDGHDSIGWEVLKALNALRNEIAHKPAGEERQKKMDRLRRACITHLGGPAAKEHAKDADSDIVVLSCALSGGFLAYVQLDLHRRGHPPKL